jgi:hypothetical protein
MKVHNITIHADSLIATYQTCDKSRIQTVSIGCQNWHALPGSATETHLTEAGIYHKAVTLQVSANIADGAVYWQADSPSI